MDLREIREERNIRQSEIASYLYISQNTYSQYENGQRQIPINMLMMLADFYGVSVDYILNRTSVKTPYPKD